MKRLRSIPAAIIIVLPLCVSGTIYYADGTNGNDRNHGKDISRAFATIRRCIDALKSPGDECHIRKGRYHQAQFEISDKIGSPSNPITIHGYRDEIPVIDGTIPLKTTSAWTRDNNGIYSARIEKDIWQLFIDGEMMTNARWPNALWSDKTVFLNEYWAKSSSSSKPGKMVDSGEKEKNLAGSGLDVTGAIAILNIGSFNTFTKVVKSHKRRQNFFMYDKVEDIKFKASHNQYFLEAKLEFLDNDGEWFYDKEAKTVYVKTMDRKSPKGRAHGKVNEYHACIMIISTAATLITNFIL